MLCNLNLLLTSQYLNYFLVCINSLWKGPSSIFYSWSSILVKFLQKGVIYESIYLFVPLFSQRFRGRMVSSKSMMVAFFLTFICICAVYHVPRRVRRGVDPFDAHKAWQDHLDRLAAIDRLYPSRYGLYLKDRAYPITDLSAPISQPKSLKGIEYEPDNKPHWGTGKY